MAASMRYRSCIFHTRIFSTPVGGTTDKCAAAPNVSRLPPHVSRLSFHSLAVADLLQLFQA